MKFNFHTYWDDSDERNIAINKPILMLEMGQWNNSKYGYIDLRPAYCYTNDEGQYTFDFYGDHTGEHILNWFTLWGQFNWYDKDEHEDVYAVHLGYRDEDVFTIENFDRVEEKFKFLRKVSTGLDKIRNKRGNLRDFAEYAQRLGEVMGVENFATKTSVEYDYPKTLRFISPGDIADVIRRALENNKIGY